MLFLQTLFLLACMHALCDYPLQGDFLSKAKTGSLDGVLGQGSGFVCLLMHCFIQAGGVFVVTHSYGLAIMEMVAHFIIDWRKNLNRITFVEDQILHIVTKAILAWFVVPA